MIKKIDEYRLKRLIMDTVKRMIRNGFKEVSYPIGELDVEHEHGKTFQVQLTITTDPEWFQHDKGAEDIIEFDV